VMSSRAGSSSVNEYDVVGSHVYCTSESLLISDPSLLAFKRILDPMRRWVAVSA